MSEPRPTPALSREQMIDMLELALGDIDGDCCRDRTGGMVLAVLSALRAAPPPPAALPAPDLVIWNDNIVNELIWALETTSAPPAISHRGERIQVEREYRRLRALLFELNKLRLGETPVPAKHSV